MATAQEIQAVIARREAESAADSQLNEKQRLIKEMQSRARIKRLGQRLGAQSPDAQPEDSGLDFSRGNYGFSDFGRDLVGGIEGAGTILQNTLVDAIGGFGALGASFDPTLSSEQKVKTANANLAAVRDLLAYDPKTPEAKAALKSFGDLLAPVVQPLEAAQRSIGTNVTEATGSPILGGFAAAGPDIALEVLGAGGGRRAGQTVQRGAEKQLSTDQRQASIQRSKEEMDFNNSDQASASRVADEPILMNNPETQANLKNISELLINGDTAKIADIIDGDPNFYRAAEQLGINVEPLAAYASRNPQFRSLSGALEVIPASTLAPQARTFIEATGFAADNLIRKYGGSTDKAQLGLDFKRDSLSEIDSLYEQTNVVYDGLTQVADRKKRFDAPNTKSFLESVEADLGGELPKELKSLLGTLRKTDADGNPELPTIGYLDFKRKEIGQAMQKKSGSFKDAEEGLLKKIYSTLTTDQDLIANQIGGDARMLSDAGKSLTIMRKQLEDNLTTLYGKDLTQALNVNVSGAIKGLSKGQVDRFSTTINAIPKSRRGEIVLSAMNDVFKGTGVNQQAFGATQFTKWYQTINRSPAAKKALFDALPADSKLAVDNLFEVSRGISRALENKIPTGVVAELFKDNNAFAKKLVASTAGKVANFFTGGGIQGQATDSAVANLLSNTTNNAKKATVLLGSPEFQNVMRKMASESDNRFFDPSQKLIDLESQLMKSKQYKQWADTMPNKGALTGGFLAYMVAKEEEPTTEEVQK
jgi:hypothetical protein